jgi:hypothetical protein
MKPCTLAAVPVLALAVLGVEASAAPEAGVSTTDIVVFNPSVSATSPSVSWLVGHAALTPAESKRILDAVFGGRYLDRLLDCPPAACGGRPACREPEFADQRRAGSFAPSIFQAAAGSFTAPQRSQTLYLIQNEECGLTPIYAPGTVTLAVVEHGVVVARALVEDGHSAIESVADLDGDGRSEVVLTAGFSNQGSSFESAQLVRMDASALAVVHDFGRVMESNCLGALVGPPKQTYSVVHAVRAPGTALTFRLEKRTEPCPPP